MNPITLFAALCLALLVPVRAAHRVTEAERIAALGAVPFADSMQQRVFRETARCLGDSAAVLPTFLAAPLVKLEGKGFLYPGEPKPQTIFWGVYFDSTRTIVLDQARLTSTSLAQHESAHAIRHDHDGMHRAWPEDCAPHDPTP